MMARFERLKWVPLLIRAYYDAQSKVQASATQTDSDVQTTASANAAANPKSQAEGRLRRKPPVGELRSLHVAKTRRHQPSSRTKRTTSSRVIPLSAHASRRPPVRRVAPDQQQVIARLTKEIQEANRKLEDLSSLQQEIRQLGLSMADLKAIVEQMKQVPPAEKPTPTPGQNQPMRPMPF